MASLLAVKWPSASLLAEPRSRIPCVGLRRVRSTFGAGLPVVRFMTVPLTVPAKAAEAVRSETRIVERMFGRITFIECSAYLTKQARQERGAGGADAVPGIRWSVQFP